MKNHKKLALIGGVLASILILYHLYTVMLIAFSNSKLPFMETLSEIGFELSNVAILGLIFLGPALVLLFTNEFKKNIIWLGWVYIVTLTVSFLLLAYGVLVIKDPLAVGLPMIVIILPLLILISIILLILKKW
jgi:hypothetical protein